MPGFIDCHNHLFSTQMRGLFANTKDTGYFLLSAKYGLHFHPEDTHHGTMLGVMEALSAGITTVMDFCDNVRISDHAGASLTALNEAGIKTDWCRR